MTANQFEDIFSRATYFILKTPGLTGCQEIAQRFLNDMI
jgi:hypothetical protein